MVWIPPGSFAMGSTTSPESQPIHEVRVDGFFMDETEVTNAEFEKFVGATGYVTVAERVPPAEDFPGVRRSCSSPVPSSSLHPRKR
jgi:formylglycine-generating enzyme